MQCLDTENVEGWSWRETERETEEHLIKWYIEDVI